MNFTSEELQELRELVEAGEEAPPNGWSPVFSLKTGWIIGRIESNTARPMVDDEAHDAMAYACTAANARPVLKSILAKMQGDSQ